jgi:hypothetical protein
MHPLTRELAEEVRSSRTLPGQMEALRGRYSGLPCVVVTCGPSLSAVPSNLLAEGLDGVLTISVKQAVDIVGAVTDFHCFNSFNVRRWAPVGSDTVRCFVREPTGRVPQLNPWDICFEMVDGRGDLARSLAASQDFDAYQLKRTVLRPFGPGIMYELVFYLAVHLGVSEVVTVGWDISDPNGMNTHYYDSAAEREHFALGRGNQSGRKSRIPELVRAPRRKILARRAHQRGELYSRTRALPGEAEVVSASTRALASWLTSVGVELVVVSDSPHFTSEVTRLTASEFVDRLNSDWGSTVQTT